ncbi:MAG: phosphoribosyltransferase family protein [Candidatus Kaiserbacteria bacterium]|nr:phosphoribosyltransferase family protein [Candidatus Kaiserbacteria bacterium]
MRWFNFAHHKWLDLLFPPRADEIVLRDVSIDDFLAKVAPRLVPETRPGTVALLSFGDPSVRAVLHEAKYHGNEHAFLFLATALADYLRDADDLPKTRFNLVFVPVPLGKERRKKRGYNQIEEVAKRAVRELEIKIDTDLLIRTRETTSQVSLPREKREENMRGAFTASLKLRSASRAEISKHTYIVVDDVITTGATLQAAIDALKEVGAEHIIPLALAH